MKRLIGKKDFIEGTEDVQLNYIPDANIAYVSEDGAAYELNSQLQPDFSKTVDYAKLAKTSVEGLILEFNKDSVFYSFVENLNGTANIENIDKKTVVYPVIELKYAFYKLYQRRVYSGTNSSGDTLVINSVMVIFQDGESNEIKYRGRPWRNGFLMHTYYKKTGSSDVEFAEPGSDYTLNKNGHFVAGYYSEAIRDSLAAAGFKDIPEIDSTLDAPQKGSSKTKVRNGYVVYSSGASGIDQADSCTYIDMPFYAPVFVSKSGIFNTGNLMSEKKTISDAYKQFKSTDTSFDVFVTSLGFSDSLGYIDASGAAYSTAIAAETSPLTRKTSASTSEDYITTLMRDIAFSYISYNGKRYPVWSPLLGVDYKSLPMRQSITTSLDGVQSFSNDKLSCIKWSRYKRESWDASYTLFANLPDDAGSIHGTFGSSASDYQAASSNGRDFWGTSYVGWKEYATDVLAAITGDHDISFSSTTYVDKTFYTVRLNALQSLYAKLTDSYDISLKLSKKDTDAEWTFYDENEKVALSSDGTYTLKLPNKKYVPNFFTAIAKSEDGSYDIVNIEAYDPYKESWEFTDGPDGVKVETIHMDTSKSLKDAGTSLRLNNNGDKSATAGLYQSVVDNQLYAVCSSSKTKATAENGYFHTKQGDGIHFIIGIDEDSLHLRFKAHLSSSTGTIAVYKADADSSGKLIASGEALCTGSIGNVDQIYDVDLNKGDYVITCTCNAYYEFFDIIKTTIESTGKVAGWHTGKSNKDFDFGNNLKLMTGKVVIWSSNQIAGDVGYIAVSGKNEADDSALKVALSGPCTVTVGFSAENDSTTVRLSESLERGSGLWQKSTSAKSTKSTTITEAKYKYTGDIASSLYVMNEDGGANYLYVKVDYSNEGEKVVPIILKSMHLKNNV